MIPFKDDNPTRHFPLMTIAIIAANVAVFILQALSPSDPRRIAYAFGAIPYFLMTFETVQPIHPLLTVFSSMFMHGGLLHLGTNMLYLWIFGNNIEDRLGSSKFIMFYILCGVAAAYAHAIINPASTVPMIGASGAVSGVLGAYLVLFPHARIHTLIFLVFFIQVVKLSAVFVIAFWVFIQIINGILSKGMTNHGGVAWFAHIGGFVFGFLMINIFVKNKSRHLYY
ncbi:MAG: rhomboid family intramembrane serine protease [Nitrospirae bacterium]|nr:rhomboid family intramembrane serine protease [Nitrospirota bacterium]